ncbi:Dihydrolipoyllysine-residue acetyltransferase component of pyruvate dehydrogenase complex, mitochondrial-like [Oopsacas minuta]|uniref:Acetyltransferase component of pyruvate dehydrogenase complex n=1 Tax=Oopsacas minuta TaxID=111878 RepID=A0AAV7K9E1_9METZ|nr:Dihydrolipoyllysine-residue acetyltransferase component of pyruvate dehydrogenase complex, mitochondrial-like [Oopsacas minuta]
MLGSNTLRCLRLFARSSYLPYRQLHKLRRLTGRNTVYSQVTMLTPRLPRSIGVRWLSDLPSHIKITLPALSPTMEVGSIKGWKLKEGDKLNEGDVLAEIETDKAVMEFSCPDHIAEGYLAKIIAPEGTKDIKLGTHICIMVEDEEDVGSFSNYVAEPEETPVPVSPDLGSIVPPTKQPTQDKTTDIRSIETDDRLKVSPYARKLAAERGVDLRSLKGTGPGGRVIANDITQPIKTPVYTGPKTEAPLPTYTDIEMSGMRRTIAKRLLESKQNIPHYYLQIAVSMDTAIQLRQDFNNISPDLPKLSLNDFVIKAAATALRIVPECNSSFHDQYYIRQHHNVDICVAVATDGGLLTPIVFTADKKGLREINRDVAELAEKARLGNLQPQEFQGGTFTISNLGMYGVSSFSAIINPPQSCILAVGSTQEIVVPDEEGCYKTAKVMNVQMSCDHRVVDGAVGAKWLKEFKRFMECPAAMLQ